MMANTAYFDSRQHVYNQIHTTTHVAYHVVCVYWTSTTNKSNEEYLLVISFS